MNLKATMMVAASFALVLAISPVGLADDDTQSGETTTCADYNAFWLTDGVDVGPYVEVDAGQTWTLEVSEGVPSIDFYDAAGNWLGYSTGASTGTVPAGAAYGTVCIGMTGFWPDAPVVTATFTYHDA